MSPIERAARAIFGIEYPPVDGVAWDDLSPEMDQAHYKQVARAVLEAIREPSEGMLDSFGIHKSRMRQNYQAMIDAALSE